MVVLSQVLVVSTTDKDEGANAQVKYSIRAGNQGNVFAIGGLFRIHLLNSHQVTENNYNQEMEIKQHSIVQLIARACPVLLTDPSVN